MGFPTFCHLRFAIDFSDYSGRNLGARVALILCCGKNVGSSQLKNVCGVSNFPQLRLRAKFTESPVRN